MSRTILATALALATLTASGGSYLWTGTTIGAWDADLPANWNASTPVFENQADINFYASGAANFNPTFLGNSDRTNRSLSFNANVLSPVSMQLDDNAGTGRVLRFEANTGNASISVDAAAAADIFIGSSSLGSVSLGANLDVANASSTGLYLNRPITGTGTINKLGGVPSALAMSFTFGCLSAVST